MTEALMLRSLELDHFTIGPTGLVVKAGATPSFEEWAGIGDLLKMFEVCVQFALGDWLAFGEGTYGEKSSQVIDSGKFSESSCGVYRWVAKNVPMENRHYLGNPLYFTHYQAVAALPPAEQKEWLDKAVGNGNGPVWPVAQLKKEVAAKSVNGTLRYLLVVECEDEQIRERLAARLESDGMTCKRLEAARKGKPKPGPVTARGKRSKK